MPDPIIRILIADDSSEMRRNIRMILALERDIEVVAVARDGAEAVDNAVRYLPDVAVVDLDMPRVNGLAAMRAIRERSPRTACIVVSAQEERGFVEQAMASGAREYFVKPVAPDDLIAAIRRLGQEAARQKPPAALKREPVRDSAAQRQAQLVKLAGTFAKERRADDEAIRLYEELAARPDCDQQWLATLAAAYLARQKWTKLRLLAERLEKSFPQS